MSASSLHVYAFMRSASSLHAYMLDDLVYYRGGEGERRRRRQRRRRAKEKEEKRIFVMTRQAESQPKHFFYDIFNEKQAESQPFSFQRFFCAKITPCTLHACQYGIPWSLSASSQAYHGHWAHRRCICHGTLSASSLHKNAWIISVATCMSILRTCRICCSRSPGD